MDIISSFIQSCQNLEAAKLSFGRWREEHTVVHPDNEILFITKMKQTTKPQKARWILNAYHEVKEANLKRLHTVWFQLYDIQEKAKLGRQ